MTNYLHVPMDPGLPLCTSGKRPFPSEAEALIQLGQAQHLRRIDSTGKRHGGTERRVVFCSGCDHWHLTSNDGRRRQTRASQERKRRRQDRRS